MGQPSLKLITDKNLKKILEYILKQLKSLGGSSSIQTISGDLVDNTDSLNPTINRGYKVYTALLTQTGTNVPAITVLQNTLGTVSLSYVSPGRYNILSSALFTNNKTTVMFGNELNNANGLHLLASVLGEDRTTSIIPFYTSADSFTPSNNLLLKTTIEIRVYN
jgi:hypothetical protein